jgi:hypothetical protein
MSARYHPGKTVYQKDESFGMICLLSRLAE